MPDVERPFLDVESPFSPGPTVHLSSTFLHIEIFNDESLANTRASALADKAKEEGIQWDYDRLLVEATDSPIKTLTVKHPSLHHIHGDWRAAFIAGPADPLLGRAIIDDRLPCGRQGSLEFRLISAITKEKCRHLRRREPSSERRCGVGGRPHRWTHREG